ncbi:MAG: transferase [Lachnospiraceae bacterium]|nr:transferase [Lachnospiraceae bacterium]
MEWDKNEVYTILFNQLQSLFWLNADEKERIDYYVRAKVVDRLERCFLEIKNKYYKKDEKCFFSPLHTCQYTFFLYFLSNTIFYETRDRSLCDRIYGLGKIVSGMDLYYEVNMPEVFFFDHPMGSVIGRAKYKKYFSFSQGCTVGQNGGVYPEFGEKVIMLSDSKVIGKSSIGNNVVIAANAYIKDAVIPDDCIVFGSSPNLVIKRERQEAINIIIKNIFIV